MTRRERTAVIAGAVVVGALVFALRIVPAGVRTYRGFRDRARQSIALAQTAEDALAALPALRDSLGRATGDLVARAPTLVSGESGARAAANLMALLQLAADRSGVRVLALTPQPAPADTGLFQRIAVRGELEGDLEGLVTWLAALDAGPPLVVTRTLKLARASSTAPDREGLRLDAEIVGWWVNREGT